MKTGKRFIFIMVLSTVFFVLTGFDLFPDVELSYKKPLIDLYGNTSPENPFFITEEMSDAAAEDDTPEIKEENIPEAKERHIIGVKYRTVTLDGRELSKDELESYIKKNTGKNTLILLWDNYAEYTTFRDIKEMLEDNRAVRKYSLEERALEVKP